MKNILLFSCFINIFSLFSEVTSGNLLIGTYTIGTNSKGIYLYGIDINERLFNELWVENDVINPSYLALSPDKKFIYAVSENGEYSEIAAFALNMENKSLKKMNAVKAPGADPCYIAVTEKHIISADYSGGSISVFGRNADGTLTEVQQFIVHSGKSIAPNQQAPHVHQTKFTPDGKFLIVTDLGTDQLFVYKYNKQEDENILTYVNSIKVKEGSGPRHITFAKKGKIIYLLHENDGTVTVLSLDKKGKLAILQETSVVCDEKNENGAADIHTSPDGKFVYATNRGTANNITCFSVGKKGLLNYVNQVSTGGKGPRNFVISPDGSFVWVANQNSNNIVIFKRDKQSGHLEQTDLKIEIDAPVCLLLF